MKIITRLKLFYALTFVISFMTCSKESSPVEPSSGILSVDTAFVQASNISGIRSLIVYKDSVIIKEKYWKNTSAYTPHDVRSVTKTVTGLLIGIAINKGYIKSEDQVIGDFLSPIVTGLTTQKANIKIRDLLTMSSGFSWNELGNVNEYINWNESSNQVQYIFDRPIVTIPGQSFNYNSAALHLLSVILTRATGMKTQDFANQYLFNPMGIKLNSWELDHQGYNNGAAGLNLTPLEMVKIGQLFLNRGIYNGKVIVPAEWIDKSLQANITTNNAQPYGPGYGYCLWIGKNNYGSYAFANGYGGQFIVVVPKLNLVVTATNNWSGISGTDADNNWYSTLNLIMKSIVPAFN